VKVLSMGFLSPEDEAIMRPGLMLNRAVQHFVEDAVWGDLDYLLADMPPGTGDIQMGLARMLPRTAMIIVTTPALAAQKVAVRAADMARKGYLPGVVGVVEKMSGFTCEHGTTYELFGSGGGRRLADEIGAPLLGRIPLSIRCRRAAIRGGLPRWAGVRRGPRSAPWPTPSWSRSGGRDARPHRSPARLGQRSHRSGRRFTRKGLIPTR
jgi:Mrp family chromosome partitioning ATPase